MIAPSDDLSYGGTNEEKVAITLVPVVAFSLKGRYANSFLSSPSVVWWGIVLKRSPGKRRYLLLLLVAVSSTQCQLMKWNHSDKFGTQASNRVGWLCAQTQGILKVVEESDWVMTGRLESNLNGCQGEWWESWLTYRTFTRKVLVGERGETDGKMTDLRSVFFQALWN